MKAHVEPATNRFRYGDELIEYSVVSHSRKSNRLLIQVHPDCRVEVQAPPSTTEDEIHRGVQLRARWIYQQLQEFSAQQQHVTPREYVSGETHYYLGKRYVLKVIEATAATQQVRLIRGRIEVQVRKSVDSVTVRRLLEDWYRRRAKEVFLRRLEALLPQTLWVTTQPEIRVQYMSKQWGSCSPSGRLTLNPNLVKARRDSIDYVILHELCHIAEHNHGENFYHLMEQVSPGWEAVKKELDNMACFIQT